MKILNALLTLMLVGLISGCVTPQSSSVENEDTLYLKEQVALLKNKVELLEANQTQLLQDLRKSKESESSTAMLKLRVDELERKITAVDDARVKENKAMVDQINAKLSAIAHMLQQPSSGSVSKTATSSRTSSAKVTKPEQADNGKEKVGYEHIVQPGETLSAIAAAYKVSVKVIMEENGITDPARLRAGQKLFIPK